MSLLTINKLTDSVGAEVLGVDPDRLATDDLLGEAVLDALEDNGVLVFPELGLNPEAQVAFCRRLGRGRPLVRRAPPGRRHLPDHAGQVEERLGRLSARHLRLAHRRLHPDRGRRSPRWPPCCRRSRSPRRGGETEFASSYAAYDALSDDEKERFGSLRVVHSLEASQRQGHPGPIAGGAGAVAVAPHPRASRWCGRIAAAASRWCSARRPTTSSAWTSTRAGRCWPNCSTEPPWPDKVYSHRVVRRRHRHLGQPRRPASGGAVRPRLTAGDAAHHGAGRRADPVIEPTR